MYLGEMLFRALKTNKEPSTHIINQKLMHDVSTGEMLSIFPAPVTGLAAAFCRMCPNLCAPGLDSFKTEWNDTELHFR